MKDLLSHISNFSQGRILVVGDIIVDRYIFGRVSRISPEAPVPIVEVERETLCPGGAANVLNNILSLEGKAYLCGVIGGDEEGEKAVELLRSLGIDMEGIVIEKDRPTTIKNRSIAHNQQVVRYDSEKSSPICGESKEKILSYLKKRVNEVEAIIISDYGKGVISKDFLERFLPLAKKRIVAADPKVANFPFYREVTIITPNQKEASEISGLEIRAKEDAAMVAKILANKSNCEKVLITRGEEGMTLWEKDGEVAHIPATRREVYDVTGAGDTVIATLTLAASVGAPWKEAAMISNYAASIVIRKIGTASLSRRELETEVRGSKEIPLEG